MIQEKQRVCVKERAMGFPRALLGAETNQGVVTLVKVEGKQRTIGVRLDGVDKEWPFTEQDVEPLTGG